MARVANVLVSFYAALFALSSWGVLGAAGVIIAAVIVDRLLQAHFAHEVEREERERSERIRTEALRQLSEFAARGCRFFGDRHDIWEFEHLADLTIAMAGDDLDDLSPNQRQIIKTAQGVVLAFNRTGWPEDLDEWKTRRLLDSVTDRRIRHIEVSEEARRMERDRAEAELRAIEARIAERRSNLKQRSPQDLGSCATAVYIITSKDQSQSKIGVSDNPLRRRAGLQTGNPSRLALHSTYWMMNRDDALLLEQQTHRVLKSRGYFQIGEWFNIEAAIADRIIAEVYDELLQRSVIVECQHTEVPPEALDAELIGRLSASARWVYSKKGNLTTGAFGKRITVFYKRRAWHWVCDSKFSDREFPTAEQAQRSAIAHLNLKRDEMLQLISSANDKQR